MSAPLYQTVIDTILDRIANGTLPPGAMLPSEIQLGRELGVAQGTARKAVMELEARGLVKRTQGRGTFVTLRTPEDALFNFFHLRLPDGTMQPPSLLTEEIRRRKATVAEREALFGAPDSVFEIIRVRALDAAPRVFERSVVSTTMFPGLSDRAPLPNTLYVFFQQAFSCIILRADDTLHAEAADDTVARGLEISQGDPVLHIHRRAYDALDRVVELRQVWCRTDKHRYFAFKPDLGP